MFSNGELVLKGESKVWKHPSKFVMDKDNKLN